MLHRTSKIAALLVGMACGCNCHPATPSRDQSAQTSKETAPEKPGGPQPGQATPAGPEIALPAIPPADPRERFIAGAVAQMLQSEHLAARPIDDSVSEQAFGYYVEHLDPAKLFLLESHVAVLRRSIHELDDQLKRGDLELARLGGAIIAERRKKVAEMVAELTQQPFDLTKDETFETDVDKREFAATEDELKDLWRRNLKLQMLERMAEMRELSKAQAEEAADKDKGKGKDEKEATKAAKSDKPLPTTEAGREAKAREELAAAYSGRFTRMQDQTPLESAETFVNAVAAVFDPHTLYLAPDDKANFDIQMTGSLEGIGAVLGEGDHYIEVHEVVPGGAAWRQGELEAGDLILSVAQQGEEPVDVGDMRINDVVRMIRGPSGTVVTLSLRKADGQLTSIAITRDIVIVEANYARGATLRLGKGHAPVGYIYLPGFYGNTRSGADDASQRNATDDVRALLEHFKRQKLGSVILDLRGNGGGLLSHATGISGLFIEQGPVVQVKAPDVKTEVLSDEDSSISFRGKLIVLVDRFSASASEILAGALQDYERALVVGTGPTHGKGTVQMLVDFDRMVPNRGPSLGVLKLTVQQYFLVDGDSTQQRGVQPDIVLPDPASFVESGERYLENPIPWSKVDALPHEDWKVSWDKGKLTSSSQARQKASASFAKVLARGTYLEARRDETLFPLQATAWQQRTDSEKKALEALDPELEEQPAQFTVDSVRYRPVPAHQAEKAGAREAAQKRLDEWRNQLAHDPWIAESLHLIEGL